jgi:hypothetical protein
MDSSCETNVLYEQPEDMAAVTISATIPISRVIAVTLLTIVTCAL